MTTTSNLTDLPGKAEDVSNFVLRNIEACNQCNRAMVSGAFAIANQQMESLNTLTGSSIKAFLEIVREPDPSEFVRKTFDSVRASMQNITTVSNILSEMNVRNSAEAAKPIQDRTYAALEEIESFALAAIKPAAAIK